VLSMHVHMGSMCTALRVAGPAVKNCALHSSVELRSPASWEDSCCRSTSQTGSWSSLPPILAGRGCWLPPLARLLEGWWGR
jgi:hypothetical protein